MNDRKTALVTGADMGFGMFIARNLEQQGWRVFATRIQKEYKLLEELKKKYPEIHPVWADITKTDDIDRLKEEIEYFIDVTDIYVPGDDKRVGEGINVEAAVEAYHKNVSVPVANLEKVLNTMTGKKRICFLNTVKSSINYSEETSGFGHNMARAALNLILVLTKNGLVEKGYTFRLFDPLENQVDPGKAAKSALGYFTRDRFVDDPADGIGRNDEQNLVIRDALGRELPW